VGHHALPGASSGADSLDQLPVFFRGDVRGDVGHL